jgi:hypothetical protein
MASRRRHSAPLVVVLAALATVPLMGSDCLGDIDPGAERQECEQVCASEDECGVRPEADCLAALCSPTGFKTFEEPSGDDVDAGVVDVDLQDLSSNDCERTATDCAELILCSCPDACARVDTCTGSADATCVDTCENLLENDPSLYLENRCKMESACADLAACGSVSG